MTKFQNSLYFDFTEILKLKVQQNRDLSLDNCSPDQVLLSYMRLNRMRIKIRARKLKTSKCLSCPEKHLQGWKNLQTAILHGTDLNPYLSKRILDPTNTDPLLNDWGVYHFHLGENKNNSGFITRTDPLLFAKVEDDTFYAINFFNHGEWSNTEIIQIIHDNWPEAISHARTNLKPSNLSSGQRTAIRMRNANTVDTVSDGTSYIVIGGGNTGSGDNVQDVVRKISISTHLSEVSTHLSATLDTTIDKIKMTEITNTGYILEVLPTGTKVDWEDRRFLALISDFDI